jgi:hypothetical protein
VVVAAGIVLIPGTPLGLITTSVQAWPGAAAQRQCVPAAAVHDREVLGPWVNQRWLNIVASIIIGVLLTLSGTLVVSTVFPGLNVAAIATVLAIALLVGGRRWPVAGDHPTPQGPDGPGPRADDSAEAHELADAPTRPAQARGLVTRDLAGRAAAPRLPRSLGHPAHRQSSPAGRRLRRGAALARPVQLAAAAVHASPW